MAGSLAVARTALFRHPSFWGEDEAEQLVGQIVEDKRVTNAEQQIFLTLAAQTTPFVASLDEATVNVGHLCPSEGIETKDVFKRILEAPFNVLTEYGWQDRHAAYMAQNKMSLGPERVISSDQLSGGERRACQRLTAGRLEAVPLLRSRPAAGDSLFEAFSLAVWGTPSYHVLLRQLAVEQLRDNPEEYFGYLGKDFLAYLDAMAKPGVGGDELVIRALTDRFGIPITVVTGDEVIWCVRYPPRRTLSQREVFLAVAPNACFSAVRRRSAITSLKLTLSEGRKKSPRGAQTTG